MSSDKDAQLVEQLIEATNAGRVTWEPTAAVDEFTSSFKGKYGVIVAKENNTYTLRMLDNSEREMLSVEQVQGPYVQSPSIEQLFEFARRTALHVDQAIDDILQELKA